MNTAGGYVLIHRSLFGNDQFRGPDDEYAAIWLIAHAAWEPITIRIGGRPVQLQRGQCAYSTAYLAEAWRCSKSTAHGRLKHFAAVDFVRTEGRTGFTIITVCNYDNFQLSSRPARTVGETVAERTDERARDACRTNNKEENQGNQKDKDDDRARTSAKPIRLSGDREELAYDALERLLVTPGWSFRKFIAECPPAAGVSTAHIGRVRDGQSVPEPKRLAVLSTALRLAEQLNI